MNMFQSINIVIHANEYIMLVSEEFMIDTFFPSFLFSRLY